MPARRGKTTYRSVVYDKKATAEIDRFAEDKVIQASIVAMEWLLSRTPEIGELQETEHSVRFFTYVMESDILADPGDVWVLYSYDDKNVNVHDLKVHH